MLQEGVIKASSSPWAFPVILVRKRDGNWRFCVDYRKLNSITVKDVYPIPRIDDVMDTLQGSRYFTAIDLRSGYWQVEIEEQDKKKTAFTTSHGLYEFNVMPFGLCNAPATFERIMDNVLKNIKWKFCLCYLDDVVIYSPDFTTHLGRIKAVLKCFRESNLRLNGKKCRFGFEEIEILGHVTSKHGIKPADHNVKAIRDFPRPSKTKEIQSFIGLCSYYRKFIKNFSRIADPLFKLTRKDSPFIWSESQEEAFITLKSLLTNPPILSHFDPEAPTQIHTDASNIGLGATLVQTINGQEKVISYISRSLSKPERNYSTTEKECLALVWSMSKLRPYLYGRRFKVMTDHHALCWLRNLRDPTGRLARWALKIQEYDFEIIYKSGKKHLDADGLSRGLLPEADFDDNYDSLFFNPVIEDSDEYIENIKRCLGDTEGKRSIVENFKEENGCLYKRNPRPEGRAWLLVVPRVRRRDILKEYHNHMICGHLGVTRTMHRLKDKYFWPSMLKDVVEYVRTCHLCQSRKGSNQLPAGLLHPIPAANYPFERVGIDFLGPLPSTKNRKKWMIVLTDYYTKYAETKAVIDATAREVAKFLTENVILKHGAPRYLISDRGSQFTSNLVKEITKICQIQHCLTTSYHPQTNGLTERLNRTLINMISMYVNVDQRNWDEILPFITHAYNTTIQETTKYSPFFLLYGREPVSILDDTNIFIEPDSEDYDEYVSKLMEKIVRTRDIVKVNTEKSQEKMINYYNQKHRQTGYEPGDLVALWTPIRKPGKWFFPGIQKPQNARRNYGTSGRANIHSNLPNIKIGRFRALPFWPNDVELWISQLEAAFGLAEIFRDETKFQATLTSLDQLNLTYVADIITAPPPSGKYDALKARLLQRLGQSKQTVILQVLDGRPMGDQKPSTVLAEMQYQAGRSFSDTVLKRLCTRRLPQDIRAALAASSETNFSQLAEMADNIHEATLPTVSAVDQPSTDGLPNDWKDLIVAAQPTDATKWFHIAASIEQNRASIQFKPKNKIHLATKNNDNRKNVCPFWCPICSKKGIKIKHWVTDCEEYDPNYKKDRPNQNTSVKQVCGAPELLNVSTLTNTPTQGAFKLINISVEVNGIPAQAFVDTGATVSIINWRLFKRTRLQIQPNSDIHISQADGVTRTCGSLQTKVRIDKLIKPVTLHVMKNFKYPLLIGLDVASLFNLLIDVRDKTIYTKIDGLQNPILVNHLEEIREHELKELLEHNRNVFSQHAIDLGKVAIQHKIITKSEQPISLRPYRRPLKEYEEIAEQVKELLEHKLIRISDSPWAFPVVMVPKKDGNKRMCIDYRKFVKDFSKISFPLVRLTRKNRPFIWNEEVEESFAKLKMALSTKPVLAIYNPDYPSKVYTDASKYGIGAILTQIGPDNEEHVIAYYSKTLQPHQENYSAYEMECLAVIQATDHFHVYIENQPFEIITDHAALQWLFTMKKPKPKYFRWILSLSSKSCNIVHRSGKQQTHVDALSRLPVVNIATQELQEHQQNSDLSFLKNSHTHDGVVRHEPTLGEMITPTSNIQPLQMIGCDTIVLGTAAANTKHKFIQVFVDHATRYLWAYPTITNTAQAVTQCLDKIIKSVNSINTILTDNGKNFISKVFNKFLSLQGIKHAYTSPYHPQCNGICEKLNDTIMTKLRIAVLEKPRCKWSSLLPRVVKNHNSTPHDVTGFSPLFLMYGIGNVPEFADQTPITIEEARKKASLRTEQIR
ncbi:hypothetical protein LAZ67_X003796, partial [Cordylochernes scorpioides]